MINALPEAWAEFIRGYEWDYFVTLTPARPMGEANICRYFERNFDRRLAKAAQRGVSWFYVAEQGAAGLWHIHAFLWANGGLESRHIQPTWRIGHVDVKRYNPNLGAAYYVTKSLDDTDAAYSVSAKMPPKLATQLLSQRVV